MTPAEIDALLRRIIAQCNQNGCPLNRQQEEILFQVAASFLRGPIADAIENPLDLLSAEQRQAFLQFVVEQNRQEVSWRTRLLNDWLLRQDSGAVQFIRDQYGPPWLNQVSDRHINQYLNQADYFRQLQVGDRIEVSNRLWEWVQAGTPCEEEWVPCTVISITQAAQGDSRDAPDGQVSEPPTSNIVNCTVRFDNGMEYDIQNVNDWNRYNWRWIET